MSIPAPLKTDTEITACLGSNAEDAEHRINAAMDFLRSIPDCRDFVATEVYHCDGSSYGNALVRLRTGMSVEALRAHTKEYERQCGRCAESKARGEISIDIDLVMANDDILRDDYYSPYFVHGLKLLTSQGKTRPE